MLELPLWGQIPSHRYAQVLNILAGIAAMPPTSTPERHLIFKPIKQPVRTAAQVGGSQGIQDAQKAARQAQTQGTGDLYYLRIVEDLGVEEEEEEEGEAAGEEGIRSETGGGSSGRVRTRWTLRFYDVPEAGRKERVMARSISVTPVLKGDVMAFMQGLGYQFVHQYIIQGRQVVHSNVVLHLHRVLRLPDSDAGRLQIQHLDHLDPDTLTPLDESGTYTLQAYVRLQDGSSYDLVQRGATELLALKELLKSSVDLRLLENRLALDTRVR